VKKKSCPPTSARLYCCSTYCITSNNQLWSIGKLDIIIILL